uniref:Bm14336 n=1 Tax=Brugia malayi TaxID=6279 RepID=A0A1I9GC11_BRUMA|nr:Bm14336 [Brugia malayi]
MSQRLKGLVVLPRGPEFNSQQPHGGSQPSIMRSGALFWHSGIHAGRILYK